MIIIILGIEMGRKNYLKLATLSLAVMAIVMPAGISAATNNDVIK